MLSFGFTHFLINGLLLVAYLKIICCSEMHYKAIPQNIRAVFNYMELHGSWKNTKDYRGRLDANLSVIYITLPLSSAVIHLFALVIDEGRGTSDASVTQVVGRWLPDERRSRWLKGRRSLRAAGHLTDL